MKPGESVLVFDDGGDHTGLQAAETLAKGGAMVEVVNPDRTVAPDVMGMNLTPYMRELQPLGVTFTIAQRLINVEKDGNRLTATFASDYVEDLRQSRSYDQIVVNHGVTPLDDLYHQLKPQAINRGEVDYDALIAGAPQSICRNADALFQLFRLGDAISSRNIHAAIYDGLRFGRSI